LFDKWKKGITGYPIVDAGMRELWQTGYMHNRVRMIVGSFLVKNLLLDWRKGERWFWDCLIDADLASNSASWQWVAGSGADAAPYFRIFNPVTQGNRFDPDGDYIRKYVPELDNLPNKFISSPWEAPMEVLESSNVILGVNYPYPIVNLKESREKALSAFSTVRIKS
jgi:deoxyribodipyrimidine photo-lyase